MKFPIRYWLPRYSTAWIKHDLIAGLTTGLIVIPVVIVIFLIIGFCKCSVGNVTIGIWIIYMFCCISCISIIWYFKRCICRFYISIVNSCWTIDFWFKSIYKSNYLDRRCDFDCWFVRTLGWSTRTRNYCRFHSNVSIRV